MDNGFFFFFGVASFFFGLFLFYNPCVHRTRLPFFDGIFVYIVCIYVYIFICLSIYTYRVKYLFESGWVQRPV